jgi:hypothetical protein
MSFNNKPSRPDSRDTAKLRAEYEKKAREARESGDPATKAKLKDEKSKLFQRVVENITHERRETLAGYHKVLIGMGKLKTTEQVNAERAKAESERQARTNSR